MTFQDKNTSHAQGYCNQDRLLFQHGELHVYYQFPHKLLLYSTFAELKVSIELMEYRKHVLQILRTKFG